MPTQRESAIELLDNCGCFRSRADAITFINTLVAFTGDNPATAVDYSAIPEYPDNETAKAALGGVGKVYRASATSVSLPQGTLNVTF